MYVQLLILLLAFWGASHFKEIGTFEQADRARKNYIIFMMTLFALQSGLRNLAVGSDTLQYYNQFNYTMSESIDVFWQRFSTSEGKDPGYYLLSKVFSMVLPSFRLFLIAISIFLFTAFGRLLYKYTSSNLDIMVSVSLYQCLYYQFFSITGIRQTIASAILFFAVPYALEKKNIKFVLLVLLAATQHKSAILFLPFFLLKYLKSSRLVFLLSFILFIPMFSMGDIINSYIIGSSFERYSYSFEKYDSERPYTFIAYILLFSIALFLNRKQLENLSSQNRIFMSAFAIALLLTPLISINPGNMRIIQYYSIFDILLIPFICQVYGEKPNNRNLYYIVFILLSTYTVLRRAEYGFLWDDMYFYSYGNRALIRAWDVVK